MELIHPEDAARIRQTTFPHQEKCYVELHRDFEYRMLHKSGKYCWFQHRVLVVHDESGKPTRMTGSIVDIQFRKELEDSLREQVRQRDDFLAILSHELRNPLGALTNALALAKKTDVASEQQERALQVIHEQSQHMRRMLDDLLDVSRVSHNKFELRKTVFNLQDTVSDVLDSLKSRAEQSGIDLRLHIAEKAIRVFADRDRILQCQVNLVGNAIKFTKSGGQIDYSIQMRDDMACIEVKDNGVGMSEYLSQHTFELFSQGANEPRNKESGIGVGLSLVRSIVELHNGRVSAYSEGLGKGSTFTMKLPICKETNALDDSQPNQKERRIDAGHSMGRKVLVIDDLPEGRSMLAQLLSLDGYEVFEAETGTNGLQLALEKNVDVAIIDLGLPDLTGYEVAAKILEAPAGKAMKLIALTGYGQPSDLKKTKDAGFHYHLTKPVELERLFELLASEP
jgi:two-component system CheB/CheR fusion protein